MYAPDLPAALPQLRALTGLCLEHCELALEGEESPHLNVGPLRGLRALRLCSESDGVRLPPAVTGLELLTRLEVLPWVRGELSQPQTFWLQRMFGFDAAKKDVRSFGLKLCVRAW